MARSVFTYGSLMFDPVWRRVVGAGYERHPATLHGYRRQRVRGASYPSLQRCEGHSVAGILHLHVSDADLAALDAFEGADYRRIPVQVTLQVSSGAASQASSGAVPQPVVAADTYLFVADAKVESGDWDARRFEAEQIEAFLRDHA